MRKGLKTIIASSMILSMSILLTGCGSSKNSTLKESLDSGETIWYKVSKTDKDTIVSTIYVFEKNGDMYYA